MKAHIRKLIKLLSVFPFIVILFSQIVYARNNAVTIGIHANQGEYTLQERWQPLTGHLSRALGNREITLEVLTHKQMQDALKHHRLEFLLTDPANYILLKERNSLSRVIATITESHQGQPVTAMAGSIIALKTRTDLQSLSDLKGKRISVVHGKHASSYQAQAYILAGAGIKIPDDVVLQISNEQGAQSVVHEVLQGRVDAGFVKAGVIEQMDSKGLLDATRLKVINQQNLPGFPYAVSTRLYPNQPLIMLPHVEPDLGQKLAAALLSIEHKDPLLEPLGIYNFGVPVDYTPVAELARELRLPPFDISPEITIADLWQRYSEWMIVAAVSILVIVMLVASLIIINRKLTVERRITQRGAMALRESTERFDLAMRAANDGLWDWNVESNEVYFSPRWKSMLGYEDDELANDFAVWDQLTNADDKAETYQLIEKCMSGESDGFVNEFRMKHKLGHWVYILSRAIVVRDVDGKAIRLVGTHVDVSERTKAKMALQKSEIRLREERDFVQAVLQAAGSIIVVLDRCGKIVRFNRAAEEITGYTYDELFQKSLWEYLIPKEAIGAVKNVFDNLVEGDIAGQYENKWLMKDGSHRLFDWRNTVIKDSEGDVAFIISQGYDITEQRAKELIIQRDQEQQTMLRKLLENVVLLGGSVEQTLQECLQQLLSMSVFAPLSSGEIFLMDELGVSLKLLASHNTPAELRNHCSLISLQECDCGQSAAQGYPRFNLNVNETNGDGCPVVSDHGHYSRPLTSDGVVLGVLSVHLPPDFTMDESMEQFLASVADILAVFVNQKHQEEIIQEREILYRSIAETSSDGFLLTDKAGQIIEVNESYVKLSGYSRDELIGMPISEIEVLDTPAEIALHIEKIIKNGSDLFETVHRAKDGHEWPVEISVSYYPIAGDVFFAFLRDISERKENEKSLARYRERLEDLVETRTQELNDSKRQLESIIENLPAIFYMKDPQGQHLMVNRQFEAAMGLRKTEVIGCTDREIYADEQAANIMDVDKQVFIGKQATTFEESIVLPDDSHHDYLTTKIPLFDEEENVYGLVGIATDISQLKSLQRDLAKTSNVLRRRAAMEQLVLEVSRILISVHPSKLDKQLESALGQIGAFLGADRTHLLQYDHIQQTFSMTHQWSTEGVSPTMSLVKDVPMNTQGYSMDLLELGKPLIVNNIEELPPEAGSLKSLAGVGAAKALLIYPIVFGGKLRASIGLEALQAKPEWNTDDLELFRTLADLLGQILHSNETRLALLEAKEEAERLARVKSEFLANMSHEIRTPLNAVLGLAQIGARDCEEDQGKNNFQRILDSGQHLYGLVNDILDFSKFEAGKVNIEQVRFNLGSVIDKSVNFIAAKTYAKGIDFQVHESANLPETLIGDPLRLTQVLGNLLSNSLKFTEQGHIFLDVRVQQEKLIFRVSDTGIGMTDEQISRLYNPFEQADNSTTRRFGGSGLGLAICSRLVEAMEGEIKVESEAGGGSSFEVWLPMVEPHFSQVLEQDHCPLVRVAALSEHDTNELTSKLLKISDQLDILPPTEALSAPFVGYVFMSGESMQDQSIVNLADDAIDRGAQVVLITKPEVNQSVPKVLRGKIAVIEQPIRCRHMINILNRSIEEGGEKVTERLNGIRILAAEDNELNRVVLEDLLLHEGAQVVFAENGQTAVQTLELKGSEAFDLVLMDIQMPVMDGYEATQRIHQMDPALPIIGLTAHAFPEEKQRCFDLGMVDHVSKPVDVDTVVTAILKCTKESEAKLEMNTDSAEEASAVQDLAIAESVSGSESDSELIEWQSLNERYAKRHDFIRKLLTVSLDGFVENLGKLNLAIEALDMQRLAFVTHAVKGSAGNIKATSVYLSAKQAEECARAEQPNAVDLAQQLAEELNRLVIYISEYLDCNTESKAVGE